MRRKETLEQAIKAVCTDREGQYGSPENNFKVIAEFWTDYLRNSRTLKCGSISAKDVAVMMTLFKIARITTGKHKDDNFVDLAGYAACAAELGYDDALQQIEKKDHKTPNVLTENLFDEEAGSEIEELRSENEKLKEDNEQLSTRISTVERISKLWQSECNSLKKENEELKQEKEFGKMYKSELEHSKEDIKTLKARIHTLYNERDYLKGENEYLKAENERLSQEISAVEAKK